MFVEAAVISKFTILCIIAAKNEIMSAKVLGTSSTLVFFFASRSWRLKVLKEVLRSPWSLHSLSRACISPTMRVVDSQTSIYFIATTMSSGHTFCQETKFEGYSTVKVAKHTEISSLVSLSALEIDLSKVFRTYSECCVMWPDFITKFIVVKLATLSSANLPTCFIRASNISFAGGPITGTRSKTCPSSWMAWIRAGPASSFLP